MKQTEKEQRERQEQQTKLDLTKASIKPDSIVKAIREKIRKIQQSRNNKSNG